MNVGEDARWESLSLSNLARCIIRDAWHISGCILWLRMKEMNEMMTIDYEEEATGDSNTPVLKNAALSFPTAA